MKPKTLEEAIAIIEKLTEDKAKILGEKKDLLKLFDEKDKEGMTETEKKLAETLEKERAERMTLEEKIKADTEARTKEQETAKKEAQERITKLLDERIVKVSKGDKKVEEKLRANISILDRLPRSTDAEIDNIVVTGFNMLGIKDANPLAAIHGSTGGNPSVDVKPSFSTTQAGKAMASKLGLKAVAKEGEPTK
jgi:hypothetical protein